LASPAGQRKLRHWPRAGRSPWLAGGFGCGINPPNPSRQARALSSGQDCSAAEDPESGSALQPEGGENRGDAESHLTRVLRAMSAFRIVRGRTVHYRDTPMEPQLHKPDRLSEPGRPGQGLAVDPVTATRARMLAYVIWISLPDQNGASGMFHRYSLCSGWCQCAPDRNTELRIPKSRARLPKATPMRQQIELQLQSERLGLEL